MKLVPTGPPGRSTRKARGYASEICELRRQGYTFEAIREALLGVGIQVSNRTVQREAARHIEPLTSATPAAMAPATLATGGEQVRPEFGLSAPDVPIARSPERTSGRDVAEEFRRRQSTNPLIRAKEQR